jgi:hypothetical protein
VDDNQRQIVDALRRVGCSVWSLAGVGKGFPDLAVGFRGRNLFLEVKDGSKPPCKRRLTPMRKPFTRLGAGMSPWSKASRTL